MERKKAVTVGLCLIAVLPVLVGTIQTIHFSYWLFDVETQKGTMFILVDNTMPLLVFAFFVSLLERFCFYHRLTICSTLYANTSYTLLGHFPSVEAYNISNMIAIVLIIIGIIGCLSHFTQQIYDFKRYVRVRRAQ